MSLVIVNRNAPDSHEILKLRRSLWEAQNIAQQLQKQNANATDEDIEAVFGIPLANGTQFKNLIDGLVTVLESNSVENYLGNLG